MTYMMKRLLLTVVTTVFALGLWAEGTTYPYLVFSDTQGNNVSVSVSDLVITISNGQLIASNSTGTQTFSLADLASMQFSSSSDGTVNIAKLVGSKEASLGSSLLFDLSGRRLRNAKSQVTSSSKQKGVYILRTPDGRTSKIMVK